MDSLAHAPSAISTLQDYYRFLVLLPFHQHFLDPLMVPLPGSSDRPSYPLQPHVASPIAFPLANRVCWLFPPIRFGRHSLYDS